MVRAWDVPKRYIKLSLYDGRSGGFNSTKILSEAGIDAKISFSTQATTFGTAAQANVNITGLTRETMGYLASSYTYWDKNAVSNRIVIDAGYENNHSIIYDGTVVEGIPDLGSADFNISLKCMSMQRAFKQITSISEKGETDVRKIVDKIAKELNVRVASFPSGEYKVTDFIMMDTSPFNQMRYLSKMTGLDIYVENQRMYVKESGKPAEGIGNFKITPDMIIGAPLPTDRGCRVQIRMNPYIRGGIEVSLESLRFPMLNTKEGKNYFIASYSHSGETKGKKWITELELTRNNIRNV